MGEIDKTTTLFFLENKDKTAFELWTPTALRPEILSIGVVFLILSSFFIYYYFSIRKLEPSQQVKGLAFFIFNIINNFKVMVFEVLGSKFVKFTPYILTLFLYIAASNLISLIGFENPTATTTVTASMAFITVIGTFAVAVRYQKSRYLLRFIFKFYIKNKKTNKSIMIPYCVNPFGVLEIVTPFLSLSLRLWGNIFAGALILTLFYSIPTVIFGVNPLVNSAGPQILIFAVFAIPIHGFLDMLVGVIQALVFIVLTLSYWGNEFTSENTSKAVIEHFYKEKEMGLENIELNKIQTKLTNISKINE